MNGGESRWHGKPELAGADERSDPTSALVSLHDALQRGDASDDPLAHHHTTKTSNTAVAHADLVRPSGDSPSPRRPLRSPPPPLPPPPPSSRRHTPRALMAQLTVASPTNIAVIKYWGKRDTALNLPINSSVSLTINQADLRTVTTVTVSKDFEKDRLWLNGEEEDVSASKRVQKVFAMVRGRSRQWEGMKVHVVSVNNFPTAAGLASSAAGYAALAFALGKLYAVEESYPGELSTIARVGSGSACRSLAGGFVAWDMGSREDGADSCARQVAPAEHWPELQVLILVVSDKKKAVSSTAGMQTAVETSPLLAHRAAHVVPARMLAMEAAYLKKDFAAFAQLAMQDSNQFHATCLDTFPPIFYLNDVSRAVIQFVHAFNSACGETRMGYTFDAGPNAVLLVQQQHAVQALAAVLTHFPAEPGSEASYVNRPAMQQEAMALGPPAGLAAAFPLEPQVGVIKHVYHTDVGPGARLLEPSESLADAAGMPLRTK
ncbi:hypothetical protein AB1Y20_012503 [Prymnesium parvum]|uniref:diphosphomevalonate decarboxylase n=1 Tax=Prymnesium parvum TaxID=97485 RepID=A0AB34IIL6_PRYPA